MVVRVQINLNFVTLYKNLKIRKSYGHSIVMLTASKISQTKYDS